MKNCELEWNGRERQCCRLMLCPKHKVQHDGLGNCPIGQRLDQRLDAIAEASGKGSAKLE